MAYTNKTPNYGLPQYLGTDKASWLDFNEPFNTVDLAIKENAANADSAIAVSSAAVNTANTASDTANSSLTKSNEALVHATSAENNANTALEKATSAVADVATATELANKAISEVEALGDLTELKAQVDSNTAGVAENKTNIATNTTEIEKTNARIDAFEPYKMTMVPVTPASKFDVSNVFAMISETAEYLTIEITGALKASNNTTSLTNYEKIASLDLSAYGDLTILNGNCSFVNAIYTTATDGVTYVRGNMDGTTLNITIGWTTVSGLGSILPRLTLFFAKNASDELKEQVAEYEHIIRENEQIIRENIVHVIE